MLTAALSFSASARGAAPRGSARIGGTFLQLVAQHGDWKPENWRDLFGQFRQIGVSQLVVQWTLYEDTAFFTTKSYKQVNAPPLETILRLADEHKVRVVLGLAHDPGFWLKIRRDPALVEVYLRRLRLRSQDLAREILPLAATHASFAGWYIPQEIEDTSWRDREPRQILFDHLRDLARGLHEISPGKEVAISGFSNAHSDPRAFEEFWTAMLGKAEVDVVLFQDGVGAQKLSLDYVDLYLTAIRKAVVGRSKKLQVVVEIFRQTDGPPLRETGTFKAVPAPLERIDRQVEIAAKYSSLPVVAFSIPEYMSPFGGAEAGKLYQAYVAP